jgi:hypothetical protein
MAEEGIRPPAVWVVGDVVALASGAAPLPADDADPEPQD